MRIIAGDLKGRKLITPKDSRVRPTTDKVKESIFNIIAPYIEDATVVDLFSGTGNLGLESISRGAKYCYFGDKSRESISLILQNIKYCKVESKSCVIQGDFQRVLDKIIEKPQIIFLDPPYNMGLVEDSLESISEKNILHDDGIIVAEHGINDIIEGQAFGFHKLKEKKYGSISITIFTKILEENT